MTKQEIEEILTESRSFFDAMQSYRRVPLTEQGLAAQAYHDVVYWIRDNLGENVA